MPFIETSAKDATNVETAFATMAKQLVEIEKIQNEYVIVEKHLQFWTITSVCVACFQGSHDRSRSKLRNPYKTPRCAGGKDKKAEVVG